MTDTQKFWQEEGGDAYTHRNRLDYRLRMPFWREIIQLTGARTVYEFGCNSGANLNAIKAVDPLIQTFACEVNKTARTQAGLAGHQVGIERPDHPSQPLCAFQMTFSVGVLIHIPPADLEKTMRGLINMSANWVLCAEYGCAGAPEPVNYQGQDGLLWRRNYGVLYRNMGLVDVADGTLNEPGTWDNLTWHLFRKP